MKRLITIFLLVLLIIPGTVAISQTSQQQVAQLQTKVGDVINGEQVLWVSPNNGEYLTGIVMQQSQGGTLDECYTFCFEWYRITMWQGLTRLFSVDEMSYFYFSHLTGQWICTDVSDAGSHPTIWKPLWFTDGPLQYTSSESGNHGTGKALQNFYHHPYGSGNAWAQTIVTCNGYISFTKVRSGHAGIL